MTQNETETWLNSGIAAAKAGQRAVARQWLSRVVQAEPRHEQAWLWLSAVVESPEEQQACLQKVLDIAPGNAAARKGLAEVQKRLAGSLLQRAMDAVRNEDRDQARELLTQAVENDEENVQAWLWLSRVAATAEDQRVCLENVLALDPTQREAQEKLATLDQVQAAVGKSLWDAPEEAPPEERVAPTLAAAIFGEDYVQEHTTLLPEPEAAPESPSQAIWAKYDDDRLCPYCAALTATADQRCAACGNPLWVQTRRNPEPSLNFWVLLSLQLVVTVLAGIVPLVRLQAACDVLEAVTFADVLPAYFGVEPAEATLAPEAIETVMAMLPRSTFFLLCIPFVCLLALSAAVAFRWRPIFYLLLASAALSAIASLAWLVGALSAHSGVLVVLLAAAGLLSSLCLFAMVFRSDDDFRIDRYRLLLQLDPGIKHGTEYLLRGRAYASQKLWALAAIHLRRAAGLLIYQADVRVALAIACIHIREYDLAQDVLEEAQRLNPQERQLAETLTLLQDRHPK